MSYTIAYSKTRYATPITTLNVTRITSYNNKRFPLAFLFLFSLPFTLLSFSNNKSK